MKKEYSRFESGAVFEGIVSLRTLISVMEKGDPSNDRRINTVYYDTERAKKEKKEFSWLTHRGKELGFEIITVDRPKIDELCIGNTHGGIATVAGERKLTELTGDKIVKNGFYVMLEGIEDPYNFGYALRSLYAAGVNGIILGKRNWMSAAGVVCRASAGASELLQIFCSDLDSEKLADLFKECGYKVVCADLPDSIPIYDADLSYPLLLVIGGERRGISSKLLSKADSIVRIDYGREFSASLSAASAATVIGFEVFRQNNVK